MIWLDTANKKRLVEDEEDVFITEEVKMGSFIGLILFLGLAGAAVYFLVIKPKQDAKKETPVSTASPNASVQALKEEIGSYLGAGNPTVNGPRPLWKLTHEGSFYGNNVEVWINGSLAFTVANGSVRQDIPDGCLWKPVSDVLPKGCAIHGPGGSTATKCVIKYKG